MYITEQPYIHDSKFQKMPTQESKVATSRSVHQKIQQLEYSINLESPRTQKAMSNLGLTKLMLVRRLNNIFNYKRNMTEFKQKNDDGAIQTTKYNWHLVELKENLLAVIHERQVITKWLVQRRLEEEQFLGINTAKPLTYMKKEYEIECPSTIEDKILKIDKERMRTQLITENSLKQALMQELYGRAASKQWEEKLDKTTAAKEKIVLDKKQIISESNNKAFQVHRNHKEKESSHTDEQYKQSSQFFDQFLISDQKILQHKMQSVEKLTRKNRIAEDKIHLKKLEILQTFDVVDQNRESKTVDAEKRILNNKLNQKITLLQKQEDAENNLQKVLKNGQLQESFTKLENINTYWRTMDLTSQYQVRKECYIKEFMTEHKKYTSEKFVKQKQRLDKLRTIQDERIDNLKEKKEQMDERLKNFEEQKVIEQNVRGDLYQQRMFKQSDLYEKNLQEQYEKEDQILQRSLSNSNKLVQKRLDRIKIQSHSSAAKLRQEFFTTQLQYEVDKYKNTPTDLLIEKFQSLSTVRPQDLQQIKNTLQAPDKKDLKNPDHKNSRSSSQKFFKKQ